MRRYRLELPKEESVSWPTTTKKAEPDRSTRVVIMAAGGGARWKNHLGVPKQLAPVKGEPVIKRTIRLLKERGITDIWVTVKHKGQYGDLGVKEYVPVDNTYGIDRIYSSRELAPAIWLYGDVYYTEKAIDTILSDEHDFWFFGRYKKGRIKNNREMLAIKANSFVIKKAGELREMVKQGILRNPIGQTLHRYIEGGKPQSGTIKLPRFQYRDWLYFTEINDGTDDFDTPQQYDKFMAPMGVKRQPSKRRTHLRILGHVNNHNHHRGSYLALSELLDDLRGKGHETDMIDNDRQAGRKYAWADVIIVQRSAAQALKRLHPNKLKVCYVHNVHGALRYYDGFDLAIFNAENIQRKAKFSGKQTVVYPLHKHERYKTTPGDGMLLVNCLEEKGAEVFYELARRMPDRQFVACGGRPFRREAAPANVRFLPATNDMKIIYSQARIVLVPSRKSKTGWEESWGRVAIEAAVSGIPVIASENDGLRDSINWAGIFCDPYDVDEWEEAVKRLDDTYFYREQSEKVLARAQEVIGTTEKQVNELERMLRREGARYTSPN